MTRTHTETMLLEALERMVALWSKWSFVSDDGALAQARRAIATAKGEDRT